MDAQDYVRAGFFVPQVFLHFQVPAGQESFPLGFAAAFCQVTGNFDLLALVIRKAGARLIRADQAPFLDLAESLIEKETSEQQFQARLSGVLAQRQAR